MNNLTVRTLSGVGFAVITLCCLLLNKFLFAAYVLFIMVVMMDEFFRMPMGRSQYRFSRLLAILSGVILFVLIFLKAAYGLHTKYISIAILPVLIVMINSLLVRDKTEFGKFAFIYTGFLYIAVPLSLSNLIAFKGGEFSGLLLLCFFIIIWCSDIGAYAFGLTFGQRPGSKKLCPNISPKKSWIGFWGGMAFAVLACIVLNLTGLLQIPVYHSIILGIIMDVSGVFGDLFESQWKRYYDIKDSGNIIPGHGGMMDRFDSTLFAVPFGAVYLSLLNLI